MADDGNKADLDSFIADLKRAWRAVGGPSYAQLEYLSAQVLRQRRSEGVRFMVLAPSTTSEILSGRRKQVLKWPWVLTFLTVLQVAARRGGIDTAVVGTIDEWKRKHEAVLAAGQAPPHSVRAGGQRQRGAHEYVSVIDPLRAAAAVRDADNEANALLAAFLAVVQQAGASRRPHGCPDRETAPEWLELYSNLESDAEVIRAYETEVVPGLLQTEAYARAIIAQCLPGATADEVMRLVELRMQHQRLHRYQGWRRLWAIVEESAFRSQRIDARIMRAQVEYLISLTDKPNVALQVVPAGTGGNRTLSEPMTIFRFPGRYLGDVVCLERPDRAFFVHERKDTDHYSQLFDSLAIKASPPDSTRRMLRHIRDELDSKPVFTLRPGRLRSARWRTRARSGDAAPGSR
jgi:hypothetical protein